MKLSSLYCLVILALAACGPGSSHGQSNTSPAGGGDPAPGNATPPDTGTGVVPTPTTPPPDPTPPPPPYPPPQPPAPAPAPPPALVPRPPIGTNAPPDHVTVGGPPATCQVYEYTTGTQAQDGLHRPYNSTIAYDNNPPTSGPNYEMWAKYRRYDTPLARPHWVHNLRHGAIVLVYRPDAPSDVIQALANALPQIPQPPADRGAKPNCEQMGIMTPDPELLDTFDVVAWDHVMTSNCAPTTQDILTFANKYIFQAPEKECYGGAFPISLPCYRFEDAPAFENTYETTEGSAVTYVHNPPTSGPFYPHTLKYGRYDKVVPAPYYTNIIAKGGVVILYRPDAPPGVIADLKAQYDALIPYWKCNRVMAAMVQDPNLDHYFAYVAVDQYMTAQCTTDWAMYGFVSSRQGWGIDPYVSCDDGDWVPE